MLGDLTRTRRCAARRGVREERAGTVSIWYYANGRSYKSSELRCLTVEFYALLDPLSEIHIRDRAPAVSAFGRRKNPLARRGCRDVGHDPRSA